MYNCLPSLKCGEGGGVTRTRTNTDLDGDEGSAVACY